MGTEHGGRPGGADGAREKAAVGASRRSAVQPAGAQGAPPSDGWDPFERVYAADGGIDRDYASKRLPVLVDLLRRHPACFQARIDVDRLGAALTAPDAAAMREAADQEAFEAAMRAFSAAHLHELVDPSFQQELATALLALARNPAMTRRDRAGAALGVALLSVPPDAKGLRGRGLMDIVLRVTMEEQTAQEDLRRRARETEGGLSAEDLQKFWSDYPALRFRHEERYRREVRHVLQAIEADAMPPVVSVDLGIRGAAKLMAEVAQARAAGGEIDAPAAERILRTPFVQDMAEDGAALVVERWRAEMANPEGGTSDERRALLRSLEMAARIVEEVGPGTDAVLFYLYMRAVVQGHYFVRDAAELESAKGLFGAAGLVPEGAVAYAEHLAARPDPAAHRRVLLAAFEVWPEHAGVRAATEAMGVREEEAAKAARLGPKYEEAAKDAPPAGDASA